MTVQERAREREKCSRQKTNRKKELETATSMKQRMKRGEISETLFYMKNSRLGEKNAAQSGW